ncbi:XRE family transcriptional regulator [Streptomyces sp. NTH33]|uniref:helix-turn-helix domain-containing protein n=1 Tax=Streptomyces sp. NTH33 TaxID=1735453 RepID=UPI000DA75961|nr:XRE family transcriptional regulator [Streptomyces sp. NTH33]PZG99990.1 XRE family transcriptional regulator [Streptomyces sp. NTH33]
MTPPTPPARATPSAPSPEQARLTAALRELRQRTGLSLAALAQRTTYSKSSWDRYLNGRTLPPRRAVEDLCRLAREPAGRCLALWEIAEAEWSGRAAKAPADTAAVASPDTPSSPSPLPSPEEIPEETGRAGKKSVALAVLASVCAVVVGSVAAALLLLPRQDVPPRPPLSASPPVAGPRCRAATCEGKDPMQLGCAVGLDTLASYRTATGARMELRYHEGCGAGWARMWRTRIGDRLDMTAGGPTRSAEVRDDIDTESYVYTPMTAAHPGAVLHACLRPAEGGRPECFDGRVQRARPHPTAPG